MWSEKVCYQKYVEKSAIHTGESLFIYHLLSNIIQKSCLWFGLVWHFWPSSASVHEQSALKISEKSRTFLNVPKCSIVSVLYFKTESLFSSRLFSTACPLFLLTYKFWGSFYSLLHRIDLTQEKILYLINLQFFEMYSNIKVLPKLYIEIWSKLKIICSFKMNLTWFIDTSLPALSRKLRKYQYSAVQQKVKRTLQTADTRVININR